MNMNRLAKVLVTTLVGGLLAVPAIALGSEPETTTVRSEKEQTQVTCDAPIELTTVVRGVKRGESVLLGNYNVADKLIGTSVTLSVEADNNSSVHPGNDLVVQSASTEVVLEDVEEFAGKTTPGTGQLVLGDTVTVTLVMGEDGTFSGGLTLVFTCPPKPEPVPTPTVTPTEPVPTPTVTPTEPVSTPTPTETPTEVVPTEAPTPTPPATVVPTPAVSLAPPQVIERPAAPQVVATPTPVPTQPVAELAYTGTPAWLAPLGAFLLASGLLILGLARRRTPVRS